MEESDFIIATALIPGNTYDVTFGPYNYTGVAVEGSMAGMDFIALGLSEDFTTPESPLVIMTYNGMTQIQPADSEEYPMASVTFPASAKIIDKGNGSSLTIKREFIPKEVKPTMIQIEATTLDELTTKFLNVFNINMADYADSASYANAINAVVNKWVASKNTDPYILIYYNYNYYTLDIDDNQNDWLYKSGMNDVSDISFTSLEVNSW